MADGLEPGDGGDRTDLTTTSSIKRTASVNRNRSEREPKRAKVASGSDSAEGHTTGAGRSSGQFLGSSEVEGSSEDERPGHLHATYLNWVRRRPCPPAPPRQTQMTVTDSGPDIEWRGIGLDAESDEETGCDDNTDVEWTAPSKPAKSCEYVAHGEKSAVTSKKSWSNGESESAISLNTKAVLRGERELRLIAKYSLGSALGWDLQGEPVKPKYKWGNAHLKAENYSCLVRSDWLSGVRVEGVWVWFTRFPPPDEYAYTVISPSGKGETLVLETSNLDKILSNEWRKPDVKWIQLELYCAPSFYESKLLCVLLCCVSSCNSSILLRQLQWHGNPGCLRNFGVYLTSALFYDYD